MPTPTRSPILRTARCCLFAAALASLATPHAVAAQPAEPLTHAEWALRRDEAMAAWRVARGLDLPGALAGRGAAGSFGASDAAPRDQAFDFPAPPDPWQHRFGLPTPDNEIVALLPYDGRLVVGGRFRRVAGLETRGIAAWDGTNWSTIGDYRGNVVRELAPHLGGLLALAGSREVWWWDGIQWQRLPAFPSWAVSSLDMAVDDDLVAVSVRAYDGEKWLSRVLLSTTSGWTTLGGDFRGTPYALAWYRGELFAAGNFDSAGVGPLTMVARWDGAEWRNVSEGLPFGYVQDLAVFNGELVAGGWFRDDADLTRPRFFARWDGTRWAAFPSAPDYPNITRLRAIGSDLYALGQFWTGSRRSATARWDGSAWHVGEDSLERYTNDIATYRGELHAGGELTNDGSRPAPGLARRRDGRWESALVPGAGMHGLLDWRDAQVVGLVATEGAVAAAGRFESAANPGGWVRSPGAALWNGAGWSALGMESWSDRSPVALVDHQGVLYAAGSFWSGPPSFEYGSVIRRQDGEWQLVGPIGGPIPNVHCMASALGYLFVGGDAIGDSPGVVYWDGAAWQVPGDSAANREGSISAIVEHGSDVVVAGVFESMGGVPCRNIAAWNPLAGWRSLGEGVNGPVYSLSSRGGALYVGGYAEGSPASAIARWKGGRWERLRSDAGWSPVLTLGWYRGRLVASGYDLPGRVAFLGADSTWHSLGSGINGVALSMVESGPSLFLGGDFSQAGGHAAYGFAEYREAEGFAPITAPSVTAAPNPFAAAVSIRYTLPAGTPVRVEIFDLAGKLVDRPFDGYQGAGPQEVVWRPESSRARTGIYFARVEVAGTSSVVRIALVE